MKNKTISAKNFLAQHRVKNPIVKSPYEQMMGAIKKDKAIQDVATYVKQVKKAVKQGIKPKKTPIGYTHIKNTLDSLKIDYKTEFQFAKELKRKYRADLAIPHLKLLIEYEGTMSAKSRHTTITGYSKDCEKYNLATVLGYRVLRYTALNYKQFANDLNKILL